MLAEAGDDLAVAIRQNDRCGASADGGRQLVVHVPPTLPADVAADLLKQLAPELLRGDG